MRRKVVMSPVKPGDATGEPNETTGLKSGGTSNPPERKATAAAWLTLLVLTILNILNFIDRFLPDAYANFIMEDLNISAMQLGILSGFGFTVRAASLSLSLSLVVVNTMNPRGRSSATC